MSECGPNLVYTSIGTRKMNNFIGNNGEVQFANGQSSRDLRVNSENLLERIDSIERLEALRKDSDEVIDRRIELPDGLGRKSGSSGGSPSGGSRWYGRITKRFVLLMLLVLALGSVFPFAWNYLQSYESTDDAQIDGHIDPLSSRIDGTVIAVHAEDDDRVAKGKLVVEIDPRDYQVAVEQANAKLDLARAQVASSRQE